jgi:hypothetical protein
MLMARDAAQAHGSRDGDAARYTLHAIVHAGGAPMGTDQHARHRNRQNLQSPPGGRNDDDTHALQAGKDGDDRRSGSDSGRNR